MIGTRVIRFGFFGMRMSSQMMPGVLNGRVAGDTPQFGPLGLYVTRANRPRIKRILVNTTSGKPSV